MFAAFYKEGRKEGNSVGNWQKTCSMEYNLASKTIINSNVIIALEKNG